VVEGIDIRYFPHQAKPLVLSSLHHRLVIPVAIAHSLNIN